MKLMVALSMACLLLLSSDAFAVDTITVTVKVEHGIKATPEANAPVFLNAARPRGPFEPTAPKPVSEWVGFTDARGEAVFKDVPASLVTGGLRLHAGTTYLGAAFASPASAPADGLVLQVAVYDKGLDSSGFTIAGLRSVVEIWEGYLVFTQSYTLTNKSNSVLDVSLLPGDEFDRGLAIELPTKAKGINVSGSGGTHTVVNSTLYWKGMLVPGQKVTLQVRFSMSAESPEFTYEQHMGFPTENVEVIVPIATRFAKHPRLSDVTLAAPGFEVESGKGIMGLRADLEFMGAKRSNVKADETFSFRLSNLPFKKPVYPWFVLGSGLLCAFIVVVFGIRDRRRTKSSVARKVLLDALEKERSGLLDDLVTLSQERKNGTITERELEAESLPLRGRLGLVIKKIRDLNDES